MDIVPTCDPKGMRPWLFMPHDLAQIALVDRLDASWAVVRMVVLVGGLVAAALARDRVAEFR